MVFVFLWGLALWLIINHCKLIIQKYAGFDSTLLCKKINLGLGYLESYLFKSLKSKIVYLRVEKDIGPRQEIKPENPP